MKITFPYIGTGHIAFKHLINSLGHEAIVPPKPSKNTLSLGVQNSPEFACLPFKILMGSYIEAIEAGAEMIITSGGSGPCRAGYYGILHEKILKDMGYDVKMIVFESFKKHPINFLKQIHSIISPTKTSWWEFIKKFKVGWEKLKVLDETEQLSHKIRPYEIVKGATTKAFDTGVDIIDQAQTLSQIMEAKEAATNLLQNVPQDRSRKPLKIGIVGEIYVVIEPFANLDIEKTLGEMGVETYRHMYLKEWVSTNSSVKGEKGIEEYASPYLNELIGGHGIFTVGETVKYSQKGFDGMIQLAPFSCIPEIVAKGILSKVTKDLDMPVLSVFLDEQTGKAGLQTRLEAFVDLLAQKRAKMEGIA